MTPDNLDGWLEDLYEDRFRDTLRSRLLVVCSNTENMDLPSRVALEWSDRPDRRPKDGHGQPVTWDQVAPALNLPLDSSLETCDFLVRVEWPRCPRPLLLAGESTITVNSHLLDKIADHRRDLGASQHAWLAFVIGAGFTNTIGQDGGGPARVESAGAVWLARPRDLNHPAWRATGDLVEPLRHAYQRLRGETARRAPA